MGLVHYIVVRRDLPLGVVAAMLTHAAGESAAAYERHVDDFEEATAVVLEARNEPHLERIRDLLEANQLHHIVVRESDPPYEGAMMAIGLIPGERDRIGPILEPLQTLKELACSIENDQ